MSKDAVVRPDKGFTPLFLQFGSPQTSGGRGLGPDLFIILCFCHFHLNGLYPPTYQWIGPRISAELADSSVNKTVGMSLTANDLASSAAVVASSAKGSY